MSLSTEIEDRGLVPTALLLTLSIVSANRGVQLLGGPDVVTGLFGASAGVVFGFAGFVGLVTLVELLTDWEVIPDGLRL